MRPDTARGIARSTRRIYNERADEYATTTGHLDQFPGLALELDRFIDAVPRDGLVLDLGCGVGRDSEYLTARGATVIAGDLSERMLEMTRSRCDAVEVVQLDLLSLPFRGGVFGGVWACASVLHLPRRHHLEVFRELGRVLGPGGAVSISFKEGEAEGWMDGGRLSLQRWFSLRTRASVVSELQVAGFGSVRSTSSRRGTWFIVDAVKR
ncbi:class I SAM-dependent DNA methyltransferase [Saccharothrix sp. Mg75]|uniref:class I SAM-dependent DNA methyltransferase n=1 Tax=Saccharothrix sp. Mg75 TaxID=3445357 RepID=UPI003EECFB81